MTAALVAAIEGARVLSWKAPRASAAPARARPARCGSRRSAIAAAATYLDALVGDKGDRALRAAFLAAGPAMIACSSSTPGSRSVPTRCIPTTARISPAPRSAAPARAAGVRRPPARRRVRARRLADPRTDAVRRHDDHARRGGAVAAAGRSLDGTLLGARLVLRFLADRLRYPRGTRLVLGNALVARLYKGLLDRDVPVWCGRRPSALIVDGGVRGAIVRRDGQELRMRRSPGRRARRRRLPGERRPARAALPPARRAPHTAVRGLRRRHDRARAGGRRRARRFRRGQRVLVPRVGRDPRGRQDRGVSAHRARPRQAGSRRGGELGSALHRRGRLVSRVHARHVPRPATCRPGSSATAAFSGATASA